MLNEDRLRRLAAPALAGAVSAVLFGTVVGMPAFLVPIAYRGARSGFKDMAISAVSAAIAIAAWQAALIMGSGSGSLALLALGLSAPLAMVGAVAVIASPILPALAYATRALAGAALAAALSLPAMLYSLRDEGVRALFEEALRMANATLGSESASLAWEALEVGIASSYAAVLFAFIFLSSWVGARMGALSRLRRPVEPPATTDTAALPPGLGEYCVPRYLVWPALAAWAALLANRFFPSFLLSAVALNAALALSICYGVQGLAIVRALAERVGLAPALRFLGPLLMILLVMGGPIGLVAVGLLALLGTLETWIPFRAATKGDIP